MFEVSRKSVEAEISQQEASSNFGSKFFVSSSFPVKKSSKLETENKYSWNEHTTALHPSSLEDPNQINFHNSLSQPNPLLARSASSIPPAFTSLDSTSTHIGALLLALSYHEQKTRNFAREIKLTSQEWYFFHDRAKQTYMAPIHQPQAETMVKGRCQADIVDTLVTYPCSVSTLQELCSSLGVGQGRGDLLATYTLLMTQLMAEMQLNIRCDHFLQSTTGGLSLSEVITGVSAPHVAINNPMMQFRGGSSGQQQQEEMLKTQKTAAHQFALSLPLDFIFQTFVGKSEIYELCCRCNHLERRKDAPFLSLNLKLPSWIDGATRRVHGQKLLQPPLVNSTAAAGGRLPSATPGQVYVQPDFALEELLQHQLSDDTVDINQSCRFCRHHEVTLRQARHVTQYPKVLVVHIHRFNHNRTFSEMKNDAIVSFPTHLYLPSSGSGNVDPMKGVRVTSSPSRSGDSTSIYKGGDLHRVESPWYRYSLFAAIHHKGTLLNGQHSVVLQSGDNQQWYHVCSVTGIQPVRDEANYGQNIVESHFEFGCVEMLFYAYEGGNYQL